MKFSLRKFLLVALVPVLLIGFIPLAKPPKATAAVNSNYLIMDSIFENSSSMSPTSINNFLNGFASSCISSSNSFSSPDPLGFSGGAYQFGGNVSAGQAIYDIAQNYHVSPQVILATMQKEQSIVSGVKGCHYDKPDPNDSSQVFSCDLFSNGQTYNCTEACPYAYGGGCMNIAMSYDCPGNCNADIEGFSKQISGGTWLLRFAEERAYGKLTGYAGYDSGDEAFHYSGPMTPGYRQRWSTDSSNYYDGSWVSQDGKSVSVTNGGTASLYTYTPFANDSNFSTIFSGWFGNPAIDTSKDVSIVGDWNNGGKDTPATHRGTSYMIDSNTDGTADTTVTWGRDSDTSFTGDFNGDGKTDLGLRRGTTFYLDYNQDGGPDKVINWGRASDSLIVGDFNGDGKTDIGLRRGTVYYLDYNLDGSPDKIVNWGRTTDSVITGDFNGDGKTDIGLRRGTVYYLDYNQDGKPDKVINWGRANDAAIVGDWNGALNAGKKIDDLGLRRGTYYYLDSNKDGSPDTIVDWGRASDKAIVGDWNGDGKDSLGLKRSNFYYLDNGNDGDPDSTYYYTY